MAKSHLGGTPMKHSRYNYIATDSGKYILFNGLNSTCIILDAEHYKKFINLQSSEKEKKELKRLGFLVEDNVNETEKFFYITRCLDVNKTTVGYRILTTLNCNARCPYCYENGFGNTDMTDATAQRVVDFLLEKSHGLKHLSIQWFGGEPLCNYKIIDYITDAVKLGLEKEKIGFGSSMVSNGLLFDDTIIEKAKNKWNVTMVQITLDGTKTVYESIKRFAIKNAFERVIENIHKLVNVGIKVSIRLNYDDSNFHDIINLISFLDKEFPERKHLHLYAYRLFAAQKNSSTDVELLKHIALCGFGKDLIYRYNTHFASCMAHSINGGTIMPDGKIAKCCRGAKLPNGIVGSIFENNYNENIYSWCTALLPNKCYECKYLPLCNGGCYFERFVGEDYCGINDDVMDFILKQTLQDKMNQLN